MYVIAITLLLFYGLLLVPLFCSRVMSGVGENETVWFFVTAIMGPYCLLYLLFSRKYKNQLSTKNKKLFIVFLLGYIPIFWTCFKLLQVI